MRYSTRRWLLLLLVAAVLPWGRGAVAQQPQPSDGPPAEGERVPHFRIGFLTLGTDVAVTSAYIWRGFALTDGACVQPDVWAKAGPITITSWVNLRAGQGPVMHFNEHDFIVDYTGEWGPVSLSAGWTNYSFFDDGSGHSNEFYGAVRYSAPLNPAVQVFHDVQQGNGTYVQVSGSQEIAVSRGRFVIAPQVSLGYNHHQYVDSAGFSDLNVGVRFTLPSPSARLTLQPSVNYSRAFQRDLFADKLYVTLSVAAK